MKSFRSFINEVEGPKSEVDKRVFREHPVKKKDYVTSPNSFDNKTSKDHTKKASYSDGADKAAYDKANEGDVKFQSGRAYSKEQIMKYVVDEAKSYQEITEDWIQKLVDVVGELVDAVDDFTQDEETFIDQYSVKSFVRQLEDIRDSFCSSVYNSKPVTTSESEDLEEVSKERLKAFHNKTLNYKSSNSNYDFYGKPAAEREKIQNKMAKHSKGRVLAAAKRAGHGVKVKATNEEVENIDEVSKERLGKYIKKALGSYGHAAADKGEKADKQMAKRYTGINRATDRLTKEEIEQVDEISANRVHDYLDRVIDDHTQWKRRADQPGKKLSLAHKKISGKARVDVTDREGKNSGKK